MKRSAAARTGVPLCQGGGEVDHGGGQDEQVRGDGSCAAVRSFPLACLLAHDEDLCQKLFTGLRWTRCGTRAPAISEASLRRSGGCIRVRVTLALRAGLAGRFMCREPRQQLLQGSHPPALALAVGQVDAH